MGEVESTRQLQLAFRTDMRVLTSDHGVALEIVRCPLAHEHVRLVQKHNGIPTRAHLEDGLQLRL